jgi:hypothetical protein
MEVSLKKKPPNPNGNPNFKAKWSSKTTAIRVPETLADTLTSLARQVDSGKVSQSTLNQLCLDNQAIALELSAITGKSSLSIAQNPEKSSDELLEKLEQFEAAQRATWGTLPQHRGEFSTTSARWGKYNEFKAWLANQGE